MEFLSFLFLHRKKAMQKAVPAFALLNAVGKKANKSSPRNRSTAANRVSGQTLLLSLTASCIQLPSSE